MFGKNREREQHRGHTEFAMKSGVFNEIVKPYHLENHTQQLRAFTPMRLGIQISSERRKSRAAHMPASEEATNFFVTAPTIPQIRARDTKERMRPVVVTSPITYPRIPTK